MAVVVILIMLTAYFQEPRLASAAVASVPAVLCGVVLALALTRSTLNIESFMGAIMAVGVAVSNAIMLVSFADRHRREEGHAGRPRGCHRGQGKASSDHHDRLRHDRRHDPDVARDWKREASKMPRSPGP